THISNLSSCFYYLQFSLYKQHKFIHWPSSLQVQYPHQGTQLFVCVSFLNFFHLLPILQFLHGVVFLASKPHVPISYYFVF
ncbi:unnamed protein product, partial [Prunus brigantina]